MYKTISIIIVIAVLVLTGGIFMRRPTQRTNHGDTPTNWKMYQNNEFGFSIKYPSQYYVNQLQEPTVTMWGRRKYLGIFDPKDSSTYEFHVIPARVNIARQPLIYNGQVYHSVEEYIQSGFAEGGDSRSAGELVTVQGMRAVHFRFRHAIPSQEDAPHEQYLFIKNDLIYEVDLKTNDPYREEILQSFRFTY